MRNYLGTVLALIVSILALTGYAQAQRVLEHPSKVRIVPATAADDSLYLFGGLTTQAGVIINADGTLNGGSTPGAGTVTFAMWDDNGCTMGEVPVYDGVAWTCGTVGGGGFTGFTDGSAATPGGYFASDPDTGFWRPGTDIIAWATGGVERGRLDAAGRMGLGVTSVQQKLHLYEASGQVAQRLERGDQETWDITVNTNLVFNHVEGVVSPLTLEATSGFVGVLTSNPAYALDVTGDVRLSGTLRLTSSTVAGSLLPETADTYDVGSAALPWRNGWITQLNSLLFVEETAQLFGGYQIVGKQVGTIDAAVTSGATTINLGETISSVPVWILIRSHTTAGIAATEYIRVVSLSSGTTYNVERDINGLHATDPAWPDGTPFLVLGTQGDGRVELYSTSGIPRISIGINNDSASSAYHVTTNNPADFTELVRIGGLDGISGAGTGNYGLFVGDVSESLIYFGGNLTVTGEVRANAGYIGSGSSVVTIDSLGLDVGASGRIKGGSGVTYSAGTGFFLGFNGANAAMRIGSTSQYVRWTGTALEVAGGAFSAPTVVAGTIDSAIITGSAIRTAASGARIEFDGTSLRGYDSGGVVQFEALTSSGQFTGGAGNTVLNTNGLFVTANTTTSQASRNGYNFTLPTTNGTAALWAYDTVSGALNNRFIRLDNYHTAHSGSDLTFIELRAGASSSNEANISLGLNSSVTTVSLTASQINVNGSINDSLVPFSNNTFSLGSASFRWDNIYFNEPTTSAALFPLVSNSGQIMAKNDGYNGTVTIAGCVVTYEFGIAVSAVGAC